MSEVAMAEHGPLNVPWRRSRSSPDDSDNYVEIAVVGDEVLMRHSKDPDGRILRFSAESWNAFLAAIRAGEMDSDQIVPSD
jgi:Domain of unknown function (DUF397)